MHETASGVRLIPRDSAGSYGLPSGTLVNTGDTILVSQHNPAMQDIAEALSNSVDRDGKGGMRADLSMNSNRITGLADGVDDSDAATVGQLPSVTVDGVPLATIFDYWGATPPDKYLLCYGQAISRSEYAELFAIIGTTAGTGDGSTTFNLPDYRGRVSAGKDNMGGTSAARLNTISSTTLGASGGAQTHTLTTAQMPAHSHTVTDPGHDHSYTRISGAGSVVDSGGGLGNASSDTGSATTGITIASTGGGGSHNNIQPTLIVNKIMKVLP